MAANIGNANRPSEATVKAGEAYSNSIAGVPPNYQVILDVSGDETLKGSKSVFPLVANLPERYHIDFSSQWSSPFSKNYVQELANKAGPITGAIASIGQQVTGIQTRTRSQSVQTWESSSPLTFSIDMIFVAKTNTEADIKKKHLALLKLCAPSELSSGVLMQPGPVMLDVGTGAGGRKISMTLGNYLFLDNIIITAVSSDVSTLCDEQGIPMHMIINVGIASFYACFTTNDLDRAFKM